MISGQFTANGTSPSIALPTNSIANTGSPYFTLSLIGVTGSSATVTLNSSYDNGVTWGKVQAYTADQQDVGIEPDPGTLYQLVVTGYASGTIKYWLG